MWPVDLRPKDCSGTDGLPELGLPNPSLMKNYLSRL